MSTDTTTLATTPREQAIADLFCTALEGGIGYWSTCSVYKWSDGNGNQINEFRAVVQDVEDDEGTEYVIDRFVIQRGMNRLYKHLQGLGDEANRYQLKACRDFAFGKFDDLDADADTGDMVVQMGLFGEIIYG
jgi:hypothetical protein